MMVQPTKKQKAGEISSELEVLFNSDTLSKIISFLPSFDVLNLAVTCKRLGVSTTTTDNNDEQSLIEESTYIAIQDIATEEQLAALPHHGAECTLANYHYLQLLREPLTFDQLVGAKYVNKEDKSCVRHKGKPGRGSFWRTAFSNNIMRAHKHYVTFQLYSELHDACYMLGVMRPGQANVNAKGTPLYKEFFQNFSRRFGRGECNNNVHCCMYNSYDRNCYSSVWKSNGHMLNCYWEGMESGISTGDELGMLLDLDEGTLTIYKNGTKLGLMKTGLAGPYCWVVSMIRGASITIKRGMIPPS